MRSDLRSHAATHAAVQQTACQRGSCSMRAPDPSKANRIRAAGPAFSLATAHTHTHIYTLTHSIGGAVSDTFSCCAVGSPRGSCMRYRHGPQGKGETGSSKRGVESAARHRNMVLPFLSSSLLPSLVGSEVGMDPWERSWKGARESSSRMCDLMRESK